MPRRKAPKRRLLPSDTISDSIPTDTKELVFESRPAETDALLKSSGGAKPVDDVIKPKATPSGLPPSEPRDRREKSTDPGKQDQTAINGLQMTNDLSPPSSQLGKSPSALSLNVRQKPSSWAEVVTRSNKAAGLDPEMMVNKNSGVMDMQESGPMPATGGEDTVSRAQEAFGGLPVEHQNRKAYSYAPEVGMDAAPVQNEVDTDGNTDEDTDEDTDDEDVDPIKQLREQLAKLKRQKIISLSDLKRFSKTLRVPGLVPDDMIRILAKDENKQKQIKAKASSSANGLMSKETAKNKMVVKESSSLVNDMPVIQGHTNAERSTSQGNLPSENYTSVSVQNPETMAPPNFPIPARISVTPTSALQFAWHAQTPVTRTNAPALESLYEPFNVSFPNLASANSFNNPNNSHHLMPWWSPLFHPAWLIARVCGLEPIRNCFFPRGSPVPFHTVSNLGHGSMGFVEEVRLQQFVPFVRKTFSLKMGSDFRERYRKIIHQEVHALSRLNHIHIAKVIGSYDLEPHTSTILMFPVGENDLKIFLDELSSIPFRSSEGITKRSWLSKWVECLTSAIAYIHSQGIRHQDVKPSNMVHRGDQIYLTDFSSCGLFEIEGTTSTGADVRCTIAYRAPECFSTDEFGKHGPGTDVFALGLVFLEMKTVHGGGSIKELRERCGPAAHIKGLHNDEFCYSKALKQIHEDLRKDSSMSITSEWLLTEETMLTMLAYERKARPSAAEVLASRGASPFSDSSGFCPCILSQDSLVNENTRFDPYQQTTTPATVSLGSGGHEILTTPSVQAPSTSGPLDQSTPGGSRSSLNSQERLHQELFEEYQRLQLQESELRHELRRRQPQYGLRHE